MTREEAIYYLGKVEYMDANEKEAIDMAIEALSADRPKIKQSDTLVRCKDCKHRYYADNRVPHERTWVCERFNNEETTDNDFCSFGERSEE